jgi:hypothetical protein
MTDEAARAAAYQGRAQRRMAFRRTQYARLAGSEVAAREVRVAWQPLLDAIDDAKGRTQRGKED